MTSDDEFDEAVFAKDRMDLMTFLINKKNL